MGLVATGCSTPGGTALIADARGATVTIESVEGAPTPIFHKYIREINAEASERQVALVLWGGAANYRLRGYLAAAAGDQSTTIAWAWDVYDTGQHRILRLTGAERAPAGRKSWAAADDAVLGRIARAGMDQLVAFIATAHPPKAPAPESAPAAPDRGRSILAVIDDYTPESSGVFRLFSGENAAPASGLATLGDIPLPRERPFATDATTLAFTAPDQ